MARSGSSAVEIGTLSDQWAVPPRRQRFAPDEIERAGLSPAGIEPSTERASIGWEPRDRVPAQQKQQKQQMRIVPHRQHVSSFHIATAGPAATGAPPRVVHMFELSSDPWIHEIEDFATAAECDSLLALGARLGFQPSKTSLGKERSDESTYKSVQSLSRTSFTAHISDANDPLVQTIERRVCAVLDEPLEHLEPPQLLRYESSQEFKVHHDGDFRKYTCLLYLNDVHAGGETEFTTLGFRLRPRRGLLLAWRNGFAKNEADMRMLHAGLPVLAGVKYCVPFFLHYAPPRKRVVYPHGL